MIDGVTFSGFQQSPGNDTDYFSGLDLDDNRLEIAGLDAGKSDHCEPGKPNPTAPDQSSLRSRP